MEMETLKSEEGFRRFESLTESFMEKKSILSK